MAPTPPGTPQNELDEEYLNSDEYKRTQRTITPPSKQLQTMPESSSENFFEQLVSKLSLFTFRSVSAFAHSKTPASTPSSEPKSAFVESSNPSVIFKPLPVYASKKNSARSPVNSIATTKSSHLSEGIIPLKYYSNGSGQLAHKPQFYSEFLRNI